MSLSSNDLKVIYTVTAMKFSYEKVVDRAGSLRRLYRLQRHRVWGWHSSIKEAENSVKENHCDMYELGYYPHVLIEKVPEGICMASLIKEIQWYKWVGGSKTGGYKPCDKPKGYSNTVAFSMS